MLQYIIASASGGTVDPSMILQAIGSVGFPIVMCLLLCWFFLKQSEAHKEETKEFTQALNSNTLILQKLADKIDQMSK